MTFKRIGFGIIAASALLTSGCNLTANSRAEGLLKSNILLYPPVFSADNKFLASSYHSKGSRGRWDIVVYDIEANKIWPMDLDKKYSWENPAFSPDGKYLALLKACGWTCPDERKGKWLTLIDLKLDKPDPQPITNDDVYQSVPAFSPDSKWITYFDSKYSVSKKDKSLVPKSKGLLIKKHNIETGVVKTVYEDADQKGWGERSFFVSDTELFAKILGSGNRKHLLHIRDDGDAMLATERPGLDWINNLHDYPNVEGASSGRIAFIGINRKWDTNAKESLSQQYDLYVHENNQVRRITHEMTMTQGLRLSLDGRKAVIMGQDYGSKAPHDVWIVDIETGAINKTRMKQLLVDAVEAELKKNSKQ